MIFGLPPNIIAPTALLICTHLSAFCIGAGFCLVLHGDLFGFRRMK
jgi:hypothetical protein